MEILKKIQEYLLKNLHLFFLGSKILASSVAYKRRILKINLRKHFKVITKKALRKGLRAIIKIIKILEQKKGKMYEVL